MTLSRILAELTVGTPSAAIAGPTRAAARKMLLDTCACAFCGREAPGIPELLAVERELSAAGKGTVWFSGDGLALPAAVCVNAAMVHALDFDNNYADADLHILSLVVPAALACGEETGATGREALDAMVLGVEVASRIAKPYMRATRPHAWFLTTSLIGGWGAVAAAARMLGLSVDQTVHAMGIYYAHTCGNRQALLERSLTKRLQPAIAAKAAVSSVLLARRGITGPEQFLEGAGGLYRCYTLDPPPDAPEFTDPGIRAMEELAVKQFPTCGVHHANIRSALLMKEERGFDAEEIERVDFYLNEGGGTLVSRPYTPGAVPQIDAQFSAPYAIALALVKGRVSVRDFHPDRIRDDRAVADLAARTRECVRFSELGLRSAPHPEPDWKYTKVTLRDGRVLERGGPSDPLNRPQAVDLDGVKAKFRDCAGMEGDADPEQVEAWIKTILEVEHHQRIGDWMRGVFGDGGTR